MPHRNATVGPPAGDIHREKRKEPRREIEGEVRIRLDEPESPEILGKLMDISVNGFRAAHGHAALAKGQTVGFQHHAAAGRALVVWNRITRNAVETGFLIL